MYLFSEEKFQIKGAKFEYFSINLYIELVFLKKEINKA